jgi:hypothetical protein
LASVSASRTRFTAVAVGHEDKPLSLMAGTDVRCSEDASRNAATQSFQKRDGNRELAVRIPRDVFAEETTSPAVVINLDGSIEQEALVVSSEPSPCNAVGLAGVARSDAIHDAAKWSSVEGGEVRPDRRRSQLSRFHARDQCAGCICFPLHVSDAARSGSGKLDAKFEASGSGAKGEGSIFGM